LIKKYERCARKKVPKREDSFGQDDVHFNVALQGRKLGRRGGPAVQNAPACWEQGFLVTTVELGGGENRNFRKRCTVRNLRIHERGNSNPRTNDQKIIFAIKKDWVCPSRDPCREWWP